VHQVRGTLFAHPQPPGLGDSQSASQAREERESLLEGIEFPWDIRPMIRFHHERWDGSGGPDGLKGEMIPLSARILSVAEVFDTLTTGRSYRNAYAVPQALEILTDLAGRVLDPRLCATFRQLVESGAVQESAQAAPADRPVASIARGLRPNTILHGSPNDPNGP
jgi:hypothetical protein